MNKDEMKMIEDMLAIIQREHSDCMSNLCENCEYYAMKYCGSVKKANALYNAGYRKVGEDEIVVKKRQYEQLKKYNRDRKRLRLKWQQAKQDLDDIYSNGFVLLVEHHEIVDQVARETRQETAREIINMLTPPCKACDASWHKGCMCLQNKIIKQIAQKYGIELED